MPNQPKPRSAREVRQEFIDFFVARGHRCVPSSPVVPQDDPTLLFTNAGMNQFKDVFLGTGRRDYTRAVNSQKCIRVSGKHNDLEEVGLDTYHHTFFEMLGNWSFGDYFKREAIEWSWELLTGVWRLPKERLWVTVFAGDPRDGLPPDDEAADIWRTRTDIDPAHVLRFGRKDNFWEMGETGPCGPCTEIHIDRGGPASDPRDGADPKLGVNAGNERFMELWNNVFMQFNRLDDGSLQELPAKHVDTGMGFERVLAVIQGKRSNYDSDLFAPLFRRTEELTHKRYGADGAVDVAFRVAADHVRAVTSAIADGALPSNEGRGYVVRRLIRRASRFGRQRLAMERPFLCDLVPSVAEVLGPAFPEIAARAEHAQLVVRAEEESFGVTLGRGLVLFDQLAQKVAARGATTLPGGEAFDLYATYGFPEDMVEQMCRERGWSLDRAAWQAAEAAHKAASRSEGKFKQLLSAEQLAGIAPTRTTCHAPGSSSTAGAARVLAFVRGEGGRDRIVLDATPFYAESGGQIGDTGTIAAADGTFSFAVEDTQKLGPVVVHVGTARGAIEAGAVVRASVDVERRERTRKNHTATHLLHKALKDVLGAHVGQQGSYVGPDRLRFDFSHSKPVTPEEIESIEALVNAKVSENSAVRTTIEKLDAAKARGVVAMFGEKYEDDVRVLDVGGWSLELCGGTHVRAAGDVGPFVIVSERAIAAGVRRVEALTGPEAVAWIQAQRRTLTSVARALKSAVEEVPARVEQLQQQLKDAKKKGADGAKSDVAAAVARVETSLVARNGVAFAALDFPDLDGEALRQLAERAKGLAADHAIALFGRADGKVPFVVLCGGAARARGLVAADLAKRVGARIGGGGGGRPEMAQGQGVRPAGVAEALADVVAAFEAAL